MARIVSVEQMRAIETEADRKGMSFDRMMDRAGEAVFARAVEQFGPVSGKRVVVLCGSGNNGGDGLVAAVHFARAGSAVQVFLAAERKEGDPRIRAAVAAGCTVNDGTADSGRSLINRSLEEAEILIDAVLGTGTRLPLRQPVAGFLEAVHAALSRHSPRPFIVAVDCPSGVDCDTGAAAPQTIPADLTVTLGAVKPGLITFPAAEMTGRLIVADIGLPPDLESFRFRRGATCRPGSGPRMAEAPPEGFAQGDVRARDRRRRIDQLSRRAGARGFGRVPHRRRVGDTGGSGSGVFGRRLHPPRSDLDRLAGGFRRDRGRGGGRAGA